MTTKVVVVGRWWQPAVAAAMAVTVGIFHVTFVLGRDVLNI